MTVRAVVKGVGHYLPERVVPNSEFEASLDTTDEWIRTRSGIERRHFAAEGQTTSELATNAARAALADAEMDVDQIDAIVLATSTADLTFPSAATMFAFPNLVFCQTGFPVAASMHARWVVGPALPTLSNP